MYMYIGLYNMYILEMCTHLYERNNY